MPHYHFAMLPAASNLSAICRKYFTLRNFIFTLCVRLCAFTFTTVFYYNWEMPLAIKSVRLDSAAIVERSNHELRCGRAKINGSFTTMFWYKHYSFN